MCTAWGTAAKSLLWEEIFVGSNEQAAHLIQRPSFGSYSTNELSIDAEDSYGEDVSDVLI